LLVILAIDYTNTGNALFETAPIRLAVWAFVLPFAAAMLVMEESRKAWVRWRRDALSSHVHAKTIASSLR
jgi:hypothetical protein